MGEGANIFGKSVYLLRIYLVSSPKSIETKSYVFVPGINTAR
jgi:hypothetical protein